MTYSGSRNGGRIDLIQNPMDDGVYFTGDSGSIAESDSARCRLSVNP